jgi:hypothetical protein
MNKKVCIMKRIPLRYVLATAVALLAGATGRAEAGIVVYATTSLNINSNSTLGTLDLTTGQFNASSTLSLNVISLTSGVDGTLYAGAPGGHLYTIGAGGAVTQFGSVTAPSKGGPNVGFIGLADAGTNGFYAYNNNLPEIDKIAPDGNSLTRPGSLIKAFVASTGGLAIGPDGSLYYTSHVAGDVQLYRVDRATGMSTAVGTSLETHIMDGLALVTVGSTLYGIDAQEESGSGPIKIYTIDTTTGVATYTGVNVTGLTTGHTIDAAAAVPEPASLTLAVTGGLAMVGMRWCSRRSQPRVKNG